MKTYQEYDAEIEGCNGLIKMLEDTISEIEAKKQALKNLRKAAYKRVCPPCQSKKEFEHHTSHSWFTTEKCLLAKGHKGPHKSHYESWC